MAQFPVTDQQGIVDGLNYVLSGPGGLGQQFQGFSSSLLQYDLTGNYREPFTQVNYSDPGIPNVQIAVQPIALSTSEQLTSNTFKFTFATPLVTPPFIPGQPVTILGVVDDFYTGTYSPIGVAECTGEYVILRTVGHYSLHAASTGGTASLDSMDTRISTDCNSRVTVNGNQDRVVISAQLNNEIFFYNPDGVGTTVYSVQINRYRATSNFTAGDPDYNFEFDGTIALKEYLISTSDGFAQSRETIFTSIIDQPPQGYYWYILEVQFTNEGGHNVVTNCLLTNRSFTAQVVKP